MPASAIPELSAETAVVCHDAGAANIVIAWLAQAAAPPRRAVMEGPAAKLWADAFPSAPTMTFDQALGGADMVLSGTGWASNIEHEARVAAARRGLRSVGVIDHWSNYRPRFVRDERLVLPDEIWITDDYAAGIARQTFPDTPVRQWDNLYLAAQIADIGPSPTPRDMVDILYVLEPARSDWGRDQPGEFQALDYFVAGLSLLGIDGPHRIRLRPHPSDPPGKYDPWIARNAANGAELDGAATLSDAMRTADWVAGCQSFALVIALGAGRRVVCTLPGWAPDCLLPHGGLIHLKQLMSPSDTSIAAPRD
jgi:hypothetical protein